jgi:hypothetical protein
MDKDTLRVRVLWGVSTWWWRGIPESYTGFYRKRDDSTRAVEIFSE